MNGKRKLCASKQSAIMQPRYLWDKLDRQIQGIVCQRIPKLKTIIVLLMTELPSKNI